MRKLLAVLVLLGILLSLSAEEQLRPNLSSPVVNGKQLFVGTYEGLVSVNLREKRVAWTADIGWVDIPPIVSSSDVFAGTIHGYVYAIEKDNGIVKWKVDTKEPTLNRFAVYESRLFVQAGSTILAYDMQSGRKVWTYRAAEPIIGPMVVAEDVVYFPSRNHFTALKLTDSQRIWGFDWSHIQVADLVVLLDQIVVLADSTVYCFQKDNGVLTWRSYFSGRSSNMVSDVHDTEERDSSHLMTLPHDERSVYAGIDVIHKIEVSAGRSIWSKNVGRAADLIYPAMINRLLFWPVYPELRAISIDTGKDVWTTKIGKGDVAGIITKPAYSNGQLYFTDGYSKLCSIDFKTGSVIWELDLIDGS